MSMQNFWMEMKGDGNKPFTRGGGKSKDAGFTMSIMMREAGQSVEVLRVEGFGNKPDGINALVVYCKDTFSIIRQADGQHRLKHQAPR